MSKKYQSIVWRAIASKREKGFALPLVLMFGLIMIVTGTTILLRSQGERTDAISQKKTEQAKALAEGGIDRMLGILNKYRLALVTDIDRDGRFTEKDWIEFYPVNSKKTIMEMFNEAYPNSDLRPAAKIIRYLYDKDTETGTLVVKGILNDGINSQSQLSVKFPATFIQDGQRKNNNDIAPIMAKKIDLMKSDVVGNIFCIDPSQCILRENTELGLREAIGATDPKAIVQGSIKIGTMEMPPVPKIPSEAFINNLGDITEETLLPGPKDQAYDGVYYYQVDSINKASIFAKQGKQIRLYVKGNIEMGGNNVIAAYADDTNGENLNVSVTANQKKTTISVNLKDDNKIDPQVPQPGQIRIYGDPPENTDQSFQLSGTSCVMAFIHAPKANIGIKGGGNGCSKIPIVDEPSRIFDTTCNLEDADEPNLYGGVWVNSYQDSEVANNSNASAFCAQPGLLELLRSENNPPGSQYENFLFVRTISPPNSWGVVSPE